MHVVVKLSTLKIVRKYKKQVVSKLWLNSCICIRTRRWPNGQTSRLQQRLTISFRWTFDFCIFPAFAFTSMVCTPRTFCANNRNPHFSNGRHSSMGSFCLEVTTALLLRKSPLFPKGTLSRLMWPAINFADDNYGLREFLQQDVAADPTNQKIWSSSQPIPREAEHNFHQASPKCHRGQRHGDWGMVCTGAWQRRSMEEGKRYGWLLFQAQHHGRWPAQRSALTLNVRE